MIHSTVILPGWQKRGEKRARGPITLHGLFLARMSESGLSASSASHSCLYTPAICPSPSQWDQPRCLSLCLTALEPSTRCTSSYRVQCLCISVSACTCVRGWDWRKWINGLSNIILLLFPGCISSLILMTCSVLYHNLANWSIFPYSYKKPCWWKKQVKSHDEWIAKGLNDPM